MSRILTSEEYQLVQKYVDDKGRTFNDLKNNLYARTRLVEKALSMPSSTIRMGKIVTPGGKKREYRIFEQNHTAEWKVDENNRFIRKNNPFYNGEIDLNEEAIDPVTGLIAKKVRVTNSTNDELMFTNDQKFKAPKRNEESAWAPALGATIYLTENDRIFGRYLETVRMPSIFEDTIGFSGEESRITHHRFICQNAATR
ncbi:hypothetical protein LHK12_04115 [Providencia rettgeri]|nr:hypothetical protein [Providencia rettgeri]